MCGKAVVDQLLPDLTREHGVQKLVAIVVRTWTPPDQRWTWSTRAKTLRPLWLCTPKGPPIHALNTPFNIPFEHGEPQRCRQQLAARYVDTFDITGNAVRTLPRRRPLLGPGEPVTAKGDGVRQVLGSEEKSRGHVAEVRTGRTTTTGRHVPGNAGEKAAFVEQVTNSFDASRVPAQACWSCTT
jgi:hypothetical protein